VDKKLRNSLIFVMCNYFNCSDGNDFQYPVCLLWDSPKCEAAKIIKRIDPLLESKVENKNSAAIALLNRWVSLEPIRLAKVKDTLLSDTRCFLEKIAQEPCPVGEHNKQSESLLCPKCGSGRTDKLLPRALCRECGQTWLR